MTPVVYSFSRETNNGFLPAVGRGAGQQHAQWYNRPTRTGSIVKQVGEGFHINWLPAERLHLIEVDADHWKSWVHQRFATPVGNAGAMTLFQASPQEHLVLAKHLTAETKTDQFIAGKGVVTKWERLRRQNHWFDALYNACAAGYLAGVRLVDENRKPRERRTLRQMAEMSGRPSDWELGGRRGGGSRFNALGKTLIEELHARVAFGVAVRSRFGASGKVLRRVVRALLRRK
jgi:hypothetical protein